MGEIGSDVLVGQLAIARGLVSLRQVLTASRDAEAAGGLGAALIDQGALTPAELDELVAQADAMPADALTEALDDASTLVLESIQRTGSSTQPGFEPYRPRTEDGLSPEAGEDATRITPKPPPIPIRPQPTIDSDRSFASSKRVTNPRVVAPNAPGLSERYDFKEKLGLGGMGEVWLARDTTMLRDVALKILRADHHDDAEMRERLEIEARVTGILEHPGIVPVHDMGEVGELGTFYTMRVVRERGLDHVLADRARREEGEHGYTLVKLLGVVRQALLALGYAHAKGVVHRDIKPENILVGGYGEVFVIDWGVAKIDESNEVIHSHHTLLKETSNALVGTPAYMSPEQARGDNHLIDARTDVYAMGVILYEILTGQQLFEAPSVLALLFKAASNNIVPPRQRSPHANIPPALEEITMRALAGEREDRYGSAVEMADAIEDYLEGLKDTERRVSQASELVEQANGIRGRWNQTKAELARAALELAQTMNTVKPWATGQEKRGLWEARRHADTTRLELERMFGNMTRLYNQALGYMPNWGPARAALAGLYWERFMEAERARDAAGALYFEGLVRQYDDGEYDGLLEGMAHLRVRLSAPARVEVLRYTQGLGKLDLEPVCVEETSAHDWTLEHGSYMVRVSAPGVRTQHIPVLLERLAHESVEVELVPDDSLPEDAVIVEGGLFLSGEFEPLAPTRGITHVPRFAIMRNSVTCGEYVAFLNDLVSHGKDEQAFQYAPRVSDDAPPYFPLVDGKYIVPTEDADGDAWDPDWPICMLSYRDASAYAHWRAHRDGVPWRLPTALEWEKAARGVDGRVYPWGNDFEPTFTNVRESYQGRHMPRPVGTHENDVSPYGVYDVAGNIYNWTSTYTSEAEGVRVLCGSSYASSVALALSDNITSPETFRYVMYGCRLAYSL